MIPIACLCIGESTTLPGGEIVTREGLLTYRIGGIRHTLAGAETAAAVFSDPVLTDASEWGGGCDDSEKMAEGRQGAAAHQVHPGDAGQPDRTVRRTDSRRDRGSDLQNDPGQPGQGAEETRAVDVGRAESYTARDQKQADRGANHAGTCASPSPSPGSRVLPEEGVAAGVRVVERLRAGTDAERRIGELRRAHGRALRVTGRSCAARARARWAAQQTWIRVSYPAEAGR